ncbi:hypothetical protein SBOR_1859 [Sclerotinia borealis F-4128]|uniref:Uncharacterized protein n=1 Tax=Sclerotinia borealis (strain F-4128) TaxID=1432307 RepID=W9CPH3_SCLBF|nr:hypothetical protein SBOR_1859 [Sclerotinia borealis F-4128]
MFSIQDDWHTPSIVLRDPGIRPENVPHHPSVGDASTEDSLRDKMNAVLSMSESLFRRLVDYLTGTARSHRGGFDIPCDIQYKIIIQPDNIQIHDCLLEDWLLLSRFFTSIDKKNFVHLYTGATIQQEVIPHWINAYIHCKKANKVDYQWVWATTLSRHDTKLKPGIRDISEIEKERLMQEELKPLLRTVEVFRDAPRQDSLEAFGAPLPNDLEAYARHHMAILASMIQSAEDLPPPGVDSTLRS